MQSCRRGKAYIGLFSVAAVSCERMSSASSLSLVSLWGMDWKIALVVAAVAIVLLLLLCVTRKKQQQKEKGRAASNGVKHVKEAKEKKGPDTVPADRDSTPRHLRNSKNLEALVAATAPAPAPASAPAPLDVRKRVAFPALK